MSTDAQAAVRETATSLGQVLLVDAGLVSEDLLATLSRASRRFTPVVSGNQASDLLAAGGLDTVVVGEKLADMSGLDFLRSLEEVQHDAVLVMQMPTNEADHREALSLGVQSFVRAPLEEADLLTVVKIASRCAMLDRENRQLKTRLNGDSGDNLIGCSPQSRRLMSALGRVAESSTTVLIEGRPGAGKSLAARVIHAQSRRSDRSLVVLGCEGMTPEALESALNEANGGTVVLESIECMPAAGQQRLVRQLKEQAPRNSDGDPLDVRVIATTSAHLPELVARGQFREDLFYRLNVFPVRVPSLQERRDDVGLLAAHFLRISAEQTGLAESGFSSAAMILLETHPWPGNVSQLQSAVFRAHALAKGEKIDRDQLLGPTTGLNLDQDAPAAVIASQPGEEDGPIREEDILPMEVEEKRLLARALKATKGNVRRAAQLLRIGRATLYRKIQIYDLRLN